jgi:hypothetical protein
MTLTLRYKILLAVILFSAIYLLMIHQKLQSNTDGVFNLVSTIYYGFQNFLLFFWIPLISLGGMGVGVLLKNEEMKFGFMYSAIGTSVFYILAMMFY